ncbi:hypothetical protein SY83_02055 [Paenibacillus swuensis]|uniref:F5/8 type C domain-containing protein n=1 Tax=Paenibacillus swuensis TaxID=1178515 RepID=A0A172TEU8_9BACL|nr:discoidin domain-containing protein [Paenibacillus swuensis]ANE45313.1 hypothetical protein SY83_02055 [Paenibacillus swuensis]
MMNKSVKMIVSMLTFVLLFQLALPLTGSADTGDGYTRGKLEAEAEQAVKELMLRVAPNLDINRFKLEKITTAANQDVYELDYDSITGKIILRGNQGYSVASAFNKYLKKYVKVDYAFPKTGDNTVSMPEQLPVNITKEVVVSPYKWRWYGNDVESYTTAFYDEADWQNRIDWYAMNGINVYLHYLGWEAVWREVLPKFNIDKTAASRFAGSPAWCNMNNNASHGEPMTDGMIDRFLSLSKTVSSQALSLGIQPSVRMFFGVVPREVKDANPTYNGSPVKYVDARMTVPGLPNLYIVPTDPFYKAFSQEFFATQEQVLGFKPKFYSSDFALETGLPTGIDLSSVNNMYGEMVAYNPDSIWCMTSWSMNAALRTELINSPYRKNILILDLEAEYRQKGPFGGLNYAWGMLQNFGGNQGMGGNLERIATTPVQDLNMNRNNGLIGISIAPEGSETNPIMYQLMAEMGWHDTPVNAELWMHDYIERRYGQKSSNAEQAWDIMKKTSYSKYPYQGPHQSVINAKPSLTLTVSSTATGSGNLARVYGANKPVYKLSDFLKAWPDMIKAAAEVGGSNGYRYDLVDVTRQVLADISNDIYASMIKAYNEKHIADFQLYSHMFLDVFIDMDQVVGTRTELTLGRWLEKAKSFGATESEKWVNDKNVRIANTIWQPNKGQQSSLDNYANKQWSGLLSDYNRPRWEILINAITAELNGGAKVDTAAINNQVYDFAQVWAKNKKVYPSVGTGNEVQVATAIYNKYQPILKLLYGIEQENIAAGKTVLASTATLSGLKAVDGSVSTSWSSSNSLRDEWLEVDLGENFSLTGGKIQLSTPAPYKMEVSGDEKTWTTIVDKTKDAARSVESFQTSAVGRYVRVYAPAQSAARSLGINELTLYGDSTNESYNVALYKAAAASGNTNDASLALDDDTLTSWKAQSAGGNPWWKVDLGANTDLAGFQIAFENDAAMLPYTISVSSDDVTYTDISAEPGTARIQEIIPIGSHTARYVRLRFDAVPSTKYASISEFKVYAKQLQKNLALKQPTVDSNGKSASVIVDGDLSTMWNGGGGGAGRFVYVDLGAVREVSAVQVVMTTSTPEMIWKYKIEATDDDPKLATAQWRLVVDQLNTTSYAMKQMHQVSSSGRYYKLTFGQAPGTAYTAALEFSIFDGAPQTNATVQKYALSKAIDNANVVYNNMYYSPSSKTALETQIGLAAALIQNGSATQEQVNVQVTWLNEAVKAVKLTQASNIAAGKTVLASTATLSGLKAVDGSVSTSWSSSNSLRDERLEVDLGENFSLTGGKIQLSTPAPYKVEVSGDEKTWTTIVDKTKDAARSVESFQTSAVGRYVRVYAPAQSAARSLGINELTLYGNSTNESYNVALYKAAAASGNTNDASLALDDDTLTSWKAQSAGGNPWWKVDLGANTDLAGFQIAFENDAAMLPYTISVSSDDVTYTDISAEPGTARIQEIIPIGSHTARYVRLRFDAVPSTKYASISEFKVYAKQVQKNLALKQPTVDSNGKSASVIVDGDLSTMWNGGGGGVGRFVYVDLGAVREVSALQVVMTTSTPEMIWKYKIEATDDDPKLATAQWRLVVDQLNTTSYAMKQMHQVSSSGRYYKLTFGKAPGTAWTAALEFSVYDGTPQTNVPVLKNALSSAIANANAVYSNPRYYNGASKSALALQIGNANALMQNDSATQEQVNVQTTLLNESMKTLR